MKNLNYSIKRNKKTIVSSETNYINNKNEITFFHDSIKIIINTKDSSFIRETGDDILFINRENSYIYLKIENIKFNIQLDEFNFFIKKKAISISYKISGDDETVNIDIYL